jgi:hypothetical protein
MPKIEILVDFEFESPAHSFEIVRRWPLAISRIPSIRSDSIPLTKQKQTTQTVARLELENHSLLPSNAAAPAGATAALLLCVRA